MSSLDYRALLHVAPDRYLILSPDAPRFTIVDASNAYLEATMTVREQIVERGLFEVFPDNPNDPAADGARNLRASLAAVLETQRPHAMAVQKYDVRKADSDEFEERHWAPLNTPLLDRDRVIAIVHRVDDVTRVVALERAAALRARELEEKNHLLSAATERLTRMAADRLAPVLLVAHRVLAMPIVGELDAEHAHHITDRLLKAIRLERPLAAVLDLSAASGFDTALAKRVRDTLKAARLLGTRVMLTGLTSEAAATLASLGEAFTDVETYGTLAEAVTAATRAGR
jgi:anti-anti-sigma regulatory factor